MRALLSVPMLALLLIAASVNTAQAAHCGAVSYRNAGCCDRVDYCAEKQQCYTVMKTCRKMVYEKQQYTCYKTVYETVCEDKTVNCVKYVPETCYRDRCTPCASRCTKRSTGP